MSQSFEEYVLDQRGQGNPFVDQLAAVVEQYHGAREADTSTDTSTDTGDGTTTTDTGGGDGTTTTDTP